jgi:hypothetical protein
MANSVAPYWPGTVLGDTRPLTSASARQRPARPRLPRNAIFLSCLRRLLCLLSARRAGGAFAACRSPWPGHGGSRYDRCWPIRCAGPPSPSPGQRAARTPPRGPLARSRPNLSWSITPPASAPTDPTSSSPQVRRPANPAVTATPAAVRVAGRMSELPTSCLSVPRRGVDSRSRSSGRTGWALLTSIWGMPAKSGDGVLTSAVSAWT